MKIKKLSRYDVLVILAALDYYGRDTDVITRQPLMPASAISTARVIASDIRRKLETLDAREARKIKERS